MLFKEGFPDGSAGKESACNVGDLGSIPELGRSPEERKGYPLQYSSLENSMNCIVYVYGLSVPFPHCSQVNAERPGVGWEFKGNNHSLSIARQKDSGGSEELPFVFEAETATVSATK